VRCHPERLDQPLHWRKPARIFVNSLSDLFHESVSTSYLAKIFSVMSLARGHVFQVLTKRPDRMRALLSEGILLDWVTHPSARGKQEARRYWNSEAKWPLPNVWMGVSDEGDHHERIDILRKTPATVRWISLEPLIYDPGTIDLTGIDWVVAGGESGPHARPSHPDWFRSVRDQCQAAGVPFFMKQMGGWPNKRGNLEDIPEDLRIRQFPAVKRMEKQ
jgi:protein gp37